VRILVTGANGFIGQNIVRALRAHGHSVVAGVRRNAGHLGADNEIVACDFSFDLQPADWHARLRGIDAAVNCAGILRERSGESFERTHCLAPIALGRAAFDVGLSRLVQISALGDPADGEFIASKHRGDEQLLKLNLPVTVLRPSLVYSLAGSSGGTSLLRALAATPYMLALPGDGTQRIQPILAEDLARIVVATIERREPTRGIFEIGGPRAITLREFIEALRAWLGLSPAMILRVPIPLVNLAATMGELFGSGPLGRTTWRITRRGIALSADTALGRQRETFGVEPCSLTAAVKATPCHGQDRWHAQLYPLASILRIALATVCFVSAVAGFNMTPDAMQSTAAPLGLARDDATLLGYSGSAIDALIGLLLLVPRTSILAARLLFLLVVGYTLVLGIGFPALWLDPLGGLVKNLVLLPAIATYLVLARK